MDSPQGDEVDGGGVAVSSAGAGPDVDAVPAVRIGVLVPLTRPGWVEAGQHLLAGIELGAESVNCTGGIGGRPLDLVVRDTAADPGRAEAAVDELAGLGVAALAGEYHSVVARAAAARARSAVPVLVGGSGRAHRAADGPGRAPLATAVPRLAGLCRLPPRRGPPTHRRGDPAE